MSYFATEYTIHFDDTMAYGSHHFLTAFKFQCAARETFLFGERVYDVPGVRDALDDIRLFTADAYARNLNPAQLGDRVAILLSLEEWGRASARFCYRVIEASGLPICAGFQTLICADARSGQPVVLPEPLWEAMEQMREIEEPGGPESFRDRILAGGSKIELLFGETERQAAIEYLTQRYPAPAIIATPAISSAQHDLGDKSASDVTEMSEVEAWVFGGQGVFDPELLSERVSAFTQSDASARATLERCASIAQQLIGGDAFAVVSGSSGSCAEAVRATPDLSQVAIHLQNVLGATLRQQQGHHPDVLMGHSFGEIAALGVGGCFDLPTGVEIVCERVRAVAQHAPPEGGLLVVSSGRHSVATEAKLLGLDQIVIAGRNHDGQTVASGPRDQLERLQEYLREIEVDSVAVPSPTSFHHPRLRSAATAWLERLRNMVLSDPSRTVYSPIGRRFIQRGDDVAATLTSQFLRPFDLQGGINDVMAVGATRFVDCGSTGSLARIISKTRPDGLDINGLEVSVVPRGDESSQLEQPTRLSPAPIAKHETQPKRTTVETTRDQVPAVAIVGQGCLLPAGASSPERLHAAISQQRSGIVDQRGFDPHWTDDFYSAELVPDRSTTHLTGRVNDDDIVTPSGVDPQIFAGFTRAQRLLCVALAPCVESLKGADRVVCLIGATADGFEDQDVVSSLRFAGIDPTDIDVDERIQTARSAFQEPYAAIKEVIDKVVRPGLEITLIDAACASSLYTVALGMQALEANKADAVIAGGVFCPGQGNSCLFSQFYGTTSTGCRPFDANADGVIFSEGAALVTIRRVADVEQHGLEVSAVIRGAGLSSDGRSTSANVPQTHGQLLSLERCYDNYGIDPSSIQAIEAHGTSTPVGDSTEVETLRQFFAGHTDQPIPLHSLKGLLGHAGWAAGTASLIAACQYLRSGTFPPQAHYREPSQVVIDSADTLVVLNQEVSLPEQRHRIAVDGFGFGGANAHIVLDSYVPDETKRNGIPLAAETFTAHEEELVFVAFHRVAPTDEAPHGMQFDRRSETLLGRHVLLPDLADDLDISQTLAIRLVDEIVAQIPQFDDDLRRQTSILLAQSGKTERGVEATMRVLARRLRRNLAGCESLIEAIDEAHERARPSGAYTLQCMMPNVSSGRAALQLNLNGPNFVVDADTRSLEAAFEYASSLLQSGDDGGTRVVVVAAIDANPYRPVRQESQRGQDEFAAAFAVTTRRHADSLGMEVISKVQPVLQNACQPRDEQTELTTGAKVRSLFDALANPSKMSANGTASAPAERVASSDAEFPIHIPVWVEKQLPSHRMKVTSADSKTFLVIAPADRVQVEELIATLPKFSQRYMMAIVGAGATELAATINQPNVLAVDLEDQDATTDVLDRFGDFGADVVLAVESITSWELAPTLEKVGTDNRICEALFLIAKRHVLQLEKGSVQLWALCMNGWNGVVHPATGAATGFLKAIRREFPAVRTGVMSTRGLSLSAALERLHVESSQSSDEDEVVYNQTVRMVRRLRPSLAVDGSPAQVCLDSESVVVATGGAHGVTAVLMDALLRDYQCTVIAVGRSSLEEGPHDPNGAQAEREFYERFVRDHPNASAYEMKKSFELTRARWEAQQTMQQLSLLGGRAEYMVADVTDDKQVASTIQQIASKYGRVDLVVHGAGVQLSKRLQDRSLADFRETYKTKVSGLRNLVIHCNKQFGASLDVHVLTSAYSLFGNDGQHDYGAANETLDRLCGLSTLHDDQIWSSIAWLAWDGIGMTRGSEYRALADQRGLSGLTVDDGQRVFRDVLAGRSQSAINVPISEAEHVKYGVKVIPRSTQHAMGRVIEVDVELAKVSCLPFHKVRNTPTMPGAWILDRMVDAGLHLLPDGETATTVTMHDISFSRFVRCSSGHEPNVRVIAEETTDGIAVWMVGDVLHPTGFMLSKDRVFAQALLRFSNGETELRPTLRCIRSDNGHGVNRVVSDPYCNGRNRDVELSGPFDCVRDIEIGPVGRRARFVPTHGGDGSGVIPAMLLDSAWRVGAMHAVPGQEALFVPVRIGRLVIPVGMNASASSAAGWEIRTSAPRVEDRDVRWDRTEVLDEIGSVQMIVEDTFAVRMQ